MTSLPPCSTKSSLKSFSSHRNSILRRHCGLCLTGWPTPPSCDSIKPAWTRWVHPAFYRETEPLKYKPYLDNVSQVQHLLHSSAVLHLIASFCKHTKVIVHFYFNFTLKVALLHLHLLIPGLVTEAPVLLTDILSVGERGFRSKLDPLYFYKTSSLISCVL